MKETITSCVALLTFSTAVWAVQEEQKDRRMNEHGQDEKDLHDHADHADAHAKDMHLLVLHRAGDLTGSVVKDAAGEDLGKVEDLLIEPASGSIDFAIVARGGVLGVGEDLYAVPFDALKAVHDKDGKDHHFVISADLETLKSAPAFPKDAWPQIDAAWEQRVNEHFGRPSMRSDTPHMLAKCSDLKGMEIKGLEEEKIGDIEELILDPSAARVTYFVLGTGGFLGLGEKEYALPWSLADVASGEDDEIVISYPVTEELLSRAPEYDKGDWNRMADPVWVREVYVFYSCEPYWVGATESSYREPMKEGDVARKENDDRDE